MLSATIVHMNNNNERRPIHGGEAMNKENIVNIEISSGGTK